MSDAEMALIEEGAKFKFAVMVAAAMDRNLRPSTLQFLGAFIRNQGLRPPAVSQAPVGCELLSGTNLASNSNSRPTGE